jgi:phosphate:Na+ symporter
MIELGNSNFVIFFAGIALFMYGMHLASQSLEKLVANHTTKLMNRLSESNFLAIVVGITLTTLLQSSGAVTSMLVNLGSARVVSLRQVMGVIIGTAVGSTLTVQLISLNLGQYALPLFSLGFAVFFLAKKPVLKQFATVAIGFALLFMGLAMISQASHYFSNLGPLKEFLTTLSANPMYTLIISAIFCAVVHSSAVTIGVAMGLAQAGAISLNDAVYWVYGANIGTTSVALIASLTSNYIGKQVAWAHFFYKTASVGIFLIAPAHGLLMDCVAYFPTTVSRSVANSHLILNLLAAVIFYPLIKPGAAWIEKLFPKEETEFKAEYLTLNNYESSALCVSYASRETMRLADIVMSMIQDSIRLFESSDPSLIQNIKDRDNKVDYLYRETKMFLLDHANKSSAGVHQEIMNMIMFLSDLEKAADSIDINIMTLAMKKNALKLEFSQEGWSEIRQIHSELQKTVHTSIAAYSNRDLCDEAIRLKREFSKLEHSLRESHIGRLNKGLRESINTSSIHLDLLSEYRRIAGLICTHAYDRTMNPEPA